MSEQTEKQAKSEARRKGVSDLLNAEVKNKDNAVIVDCARGPLLVEVL